MWSPPEDPATPFSTGTKMIRAPECTLQLNPSCQGYTGSLMDKSKNEFKRQSSAQQRNPLLNSPTSSKDQSISSQSDSTPNLKTISTSNATADSTPFSET